MVQATALQRTCMARKGLQSQEIEQDLGFRWREGWVARVPLDQGICMCRLSDPGAPQELSGTPTR